jgi:hypothetical protein
MSVDFGSDPNSVTAASCHMGLITSRGKVACPFFGSKTSAGDRTKFAKPRLNIDIPQLHATIQILSRQKPTVRSESY